MLDGDPQDAPGAHDHMEPGFSVKCRMSYHVLLQQKTSPTEQSTRANAVEQFMGIECTAETK